MTKNIDEGQCPQTLLEQVAEAMAVYAGTMDDDRFIPQAEQLLSSFQASEGRSATHYLEIGEFSKRHLHPSGKFLVTCKCDL
jgi:hypothetical protein